MSGKRKCIYVGCRANVNRSFILEQLLREATIQASLPIDVRSGGVMIAQGLPNMSYCPHAIVEFVQALYKTGLDFIIPRIRQHQAHAFTLPDLQQADLIITMTKKQRDHLQQYAPVTTTIIMLSQLRDPSHEEDILDAMFAPISVEAFVQQIKQLQSYINLDQIKNILRLE